MESVTFPLWFPFHPVTGSNRSGQRDTEIPTGLHSIYSFTGSIVQGNPNQWFNPAAFILPTPGTYGNLGGVHPRGQFSRMSIFLSKNTGITEKTTLQFRR